MDVPSEEREKESVQDIFGIDAFGSKRLKRVRC
jgi:hypothetical protein